MLIWNIRAIVGKTCPLSCLLCLICLGEVRYDAYWERQEVSLYVSKRWFKAITHYKQNIELHTVLNHHVNVIIEVNHAHGLQIPW